MTSGATIPEVCYGIPLRGAATATAALEAYFEAPPSWRMKVEQESGLPASLSGMPAAIFFTFASEWN